MARRAVDAHGVRTGMRRQTPVDRFDEAVGEDERIAAGSFNMDPGMRAPDEFTDVTSEGYRESAKRVAERGGAKEYATSVEEEEADSEADELRGQLLFALAALGLGGVGGMAANRALGPGARPGLGLGPAPTMQAPYPRGGVPPGAWEGVHQPRPFLRGSTSGADHWRHPRYFKENRPTHSSLQDLGIPRRYPRDSLVWDKRTGYGSQSPIAHHGEMQAGGHLRPGVHPNPMGPRIDPETLTAMIRQLGRGAPWN